MSDDLFSPSRSSVPSRSSDQRGTSRSDINPSSEKETSSPFRKLQFTFSPSGERENARSGANGSAGLSRASDVSRDSAMIELVRLANETIVQSSREMNGILKNQGVIAATGHLPSERNYVDNPNVNQQNVRRIIQLVQTSLGVAPTGNYDEMTAARVLQFQQAFNQSRSGKTLLEDSKVGKQTLGAILEELGLKNHPQLLMADRTSK